MADALLDVSNLSVRYGSGKWGLRDLSLTVDAGETVGLMGESGCGKSTAAWAVLGLLPDDATVSGSIRLCGRPFDRAMRGRVVSLIPQEPTAALSPVMRIGHQMGEVCGGQSRATVMEMLARLGLAEELYNAYPHQMSGGQLQRVVIGQALLCKPKLLIADELTATLDPETRTSVVGTLKALQREFGFGLLVITHDSDVLKGWAERVIDISPKETISERQSSPGRSGDWLLRVRGLAKRYKRVEAVRGVDLELKIGERVVISGESGSGKSTLAKCLAGWEAADSGTVELAGRGRRPQLIPQEPGESLNPFWETWEVVAESLQLKGLPKRQRKDRALDWMQRVGLPAELAHRKSTTCSGGERARIAIARALAACECDAGNPAVLILDESLSGLNLVLRAQVLDLLSKLQERWPLGYIVITHDEWVAKRFGDTKVVMNQGRLSA